jgi:hypothetical protein
MKKKMLLAILKKLKEISEEANMEVDNKNDAKILNRLLIILNGVKL